MRFALGLLAAAALSVFACSPDGSSTPNAGGQTGDPGVADFESIDPGAPKAPGGAVGGASCAGAVQVIADPRVRGEVQHEKLDDEHFVLFDEARGLVVVDTSPATPRVVGRVPLPRSAGQLHLKGQHAFLVRRNVRSWTSYAIAGFPPIGDEAELLVIDLADVSAPKIVSRLALERAARTSVLTEVGDSTRIHVLSDGGATGGCSGVERAVHVTSFAWTDGRLEKMSVFTLAEDFGDGMIVAALERGLLVVRRKQADHQLSVVSFSTSDGAPSESQRIAAHQPAALHEDEDGTVRSLNGNSLDVYDLREPNHPKLKSRCAIGQRFFPNRVTFSPHHVFDWGGSRDGVNTVTSISVRPDGGCDVRRHSGAGMRDLQPLGHLAPARVLDIEGNQRGQLKVRLLDDADLHVIDEVTVAGHEARFDTARVASDGERIALWLDVYEKDASGTLSQSLRLLELTGDALRVRGAVGPASRLLSLDLTKTMAWGPGLSGAQRTLAGIALTDLDQPKLGPALDLVPRFTQVIALDTHWARLRAPDEVYRTQLTADELEASRAEGSLELVPIDQDPDLAGETARVDASPFGRMVRVGSLLVSIARGFKLNEQGVRSERDPAPTLFEVFDVSDADEPRRMGGLRVESLALPSTCAYCTGSILDTRDIVVPGALVLRAYADDGKLTLRVLDLSDPAQPRLSAPITRADDESILAAFSEGSSVYYSFRKPAMAASSSDLARFYFRRVDLATVNKPRHDEPVSVPGQLLAVSGSALYTREFVREGGELATSVHRLSLDRNRAQIEATHLVGPRVALRIERTPSGHLLLDLQDPVQRFFYATRTSSVETDLRVLDADTLRFIGEGHVGPGATRLGVQGTRALYGAADGVVLMDLSEPSAPRQQAYVPNWNGTGRGIITSDSFVLEDSGALKRYGFDFANLP